MREIKVKRMSSKIIGTKNGGERMRELTTKEIANKLAILRKSLQDEAKGREWDADIEGTTEKIQCFLRGKAEAYRDSARCIHNLLAYMSLIKEVKECQTQESKH